MDSGRIINSVKSRMRKSRTSGSVRVTPSNWRVYSTPIMNIEKATDMELYFDEQPVEVTAIAYPADFLGTEASGEEGETASIETDEDGNFVLKNAREGMIYLIRGQWENGWSEYGFTVAGRQKQLSS